MEKTYSLEQLKKDYSELQKKHNLPSFKEMNENFHIERLDKEKEILISEIRRWVWDKFSVYMRLTESMINPVNASIFIFTIIKNLTVEEKNNLSEIYKKMAGIELDIIRLDLEFNEKQEAEFIRDSFKIWVDIRNDLLKIMDKAKKNMGNKSEENSKGYFG